MASLFRTIAGIAKLLVLVPAGFGAALAAPAAAQSDLLVAPTRLVLDGRANGQIILSNIGSKEATYRVTAVLRRMTPDGGLDVVDPAQANAIEQAALEMIRFAPRRVVLPPGQPQSVRVSTRPPADLPDGEYRIHLSFNGVPDVAAVDAAEDPAEAQGLSIQLIPIYGITIPVIVRMGRVEASVAISNPRIEQDGNGGHALKLDMVRNGGASVFGEIIVMQPGVSEPVYRARGVAVYPEVDNRILSLPVGAEVAATLRNAGRLRVEYRELAEQGGALLASVEGAVGQGG